MVVFIVVFISLGGCFRRVRVQTAQTCVFALHILLFPGKVGEHVIKRVMMTVFVAETVRHGLDGRIRIAAVEGNDSRFALKADLEVGGQGGEV